MCEVLGLDKNASETTREVSFRGCFVIGARWLSASTDSLAGPQSRWGQMTNSQSFHWYSSLRQRFIAQLPSWNPSISVRFVESSLSNYPLNTRDIGKESSGIACMVLSDDSRMHTYDRRTQRILRVQRLRLPGLSGITGHVRL